MTDTIEATSTEIEPVSDRNLFQVDDPVAVLEAAKRVASALKAEIAAGGMVQQIGGREHVRVEGWQTAGAMLGLHAYVVWSRPLEDGWEARAEVRTVDGRVIGAGEAMCTRAERNWARRDPYMLRAMCQTRAVSRALKGPLGFVMTLAGHDATPAEEIDMQQGTPEPTPAELPAWAKPADAASTGKAIRAILTAAKVTTPTELALGIGERAFKQFDRSIPACVLSVLEDVVATIESAAILGEAAPEGLPDEAR